MYTLQFISIYTSRCIAKQEDKVSVERDCYWHWQVKWDEMEENPREITQLHFAVWSDAQDERCNASEGIIEVVQWDWTCVVYANRLQV